MLEVKEELANSSLTFNVFPSPAGSSLTLNVFPELASDGKTSNIKEKSADLRCLNFNLDFTPPLASRSLPV